MTESRRLHLELSEEEARVLVAAMSLLPLTFDGESLEEILKALDVDRRMLVVASVAMMAGAKHVSKIEEETSDANMEANVKRCSVLMQKLHDWLIGEKADGMDN